MKSYLPIEACNEQFTTVDTVSLHTVIGYARDYAKIMAERQRNEGHEVLAQSWDEAELMMHETSHHIERIIDPTGDLTKFIDSLITAPMHQVVSARYPLEEDDKVQRDKMARPSREGSVGRAGRAGRGQKFVWEEGDIKITKASTSDSSEKGNE